MTQFFKKAFTFKPELSNFALYQNSGRADIEVPVDLGTRALIDQYYIADSLIADCADIPFGHQGADLHGVAQEIVSQISKVLLECPKLKVILEGHTGGMKSEPKERLEHLSRVRADVVRYGFQKEGIKNKMEIKPMGGELLLQNGIVRIVLVEPPLEPPEPPPPIPIVHHGMPEVTAIQIGNYRDEARRVISEARYVANSVALDTKAFRHDYDELFGSSFTMKQHIKHEAMNDALAAIPANTAAERRRIVNVQRETPNLLALTNEGQYAAQQIYHPEAPLAVAVGASKDAASAAAADARLQAAEANAQANAAAVHVASGREAMARMKAQKANEEVERLKAAEGCDEEEVLKEGGLFLSPQVYKSPTASSQSLHSMDIMEYYVEQPKNRGLLGLLGLGACVSGANCCSAEVRITKQVRHDDMPP